MNPNELKTIMNEKYFVELKNGFIACPVVYYGDDEDNLGRPLGFRNENWTACWNLDGSSVTNREFDMVKILQKVQT